MPKIYKRNCNYCGKHYTGQGRFFCSMSCRMKQRNIDDNPMWHSSARAKVSKCMKGNKYCVGRVVSKETRQKMSDALTGREITPEHKEAISRTLKKIGHRPPPPPSGPNNPRWKGGGKQHRYKTPEYKLFVIDVLKRDNYTCQHCHATNSHGENVVLQVHHIKSYLSFPDLRLDTDNGITLCIDCHRKSHAGMPRPVDPNYKGKARICKICSQSFHIRNGRKYCPECRKAYCCPVCGSTKCNHNARRSLHNTKHP